MAYYKNEVTSNTETTIKEQTTTKEIIEKETINFKKTERFKKMFGEQKGYEGKDGCYKIIVKDSISLETYIFYIKDEKVIYYEDEESVNYIEYTDVTIELPTLEFTEDPYY